MREIRKNNSKYIILAFTIIIVLNMSPVNGAEFRERDISVIIGTSAVLNIETYNTLPGEESSTLALSTIPAGNDNFVFEDSGTNTLDITLLPGESNVYRAVYDAKEEGDFDIIVTQDGVSDTAQLKVTGNPDFPESDNLVIVLIAVLSLLIYVFFKA